MSKAETQVCARGRVIQSAVAVAIPCGDRHFLDAPAALGPPTESEGHHSDEEARVDSTESPETLCYEPSSDEKESEDLARREASVQTELSIPMNVQIFGFPGLEGAGPQISRG